MSGIIPNGRQQFFNSNGGPLAGGFVYYYIPGTTTFKNTYQDDTLTTLNTNPIVLDGIGSCQAYGSGSYRQQVYDVNMNLIWDVQTDAPQSFSFSDYTISESNSKLFFYFQGTPIASLDQYGNWKTLGSVYSATTP